MKVSVWLSGCLCMCLWLWLWLRLCLCVRVGVGRAVRSRERTPAVRCGAVDRGERRRPTQIATKLAQGDLLGAFGAFDEMLNGDEYPCVSRPPARCVT